MFPASVKMAAPIVSTMNMRGIQGIADSYHNVSDPDANSALMELEKGLRSSNVGEQCEAVVRFPTLFEKYPFPILINSAVLKLADVFRADFSNNFIRLCILKVVQQTEKHHDKVLNVEDFLRRIFAVIHSNDPVARAITLRTLGSIANMIREKKIIHHSIVVALDSHDNVEVEAAIFAAERFADKSKTFAANNCEKLSQMIESITTPADRKLKLIPIMQHMYHDASTASKAREVCKSLLPKYPTKQFVTVILHTMSQLTARSLMDIPQQVELLTSYLESDPRRQVRMIALSDLCMLARIAPHLWKVDTVEVLCRFAMKVTFPGLVWGILRVLTTLSSSLAVNLFSLSPGSLGLEVCQRYCYHADTSLAVKAVELLTDLALAGYNKGGAGLVEQTVSAIQTLLRLSTLQPAFSKDYTNVKLVLKCAVRICCHIPSACSVCVETLADLLLSVSGHLSELLSEGLAAIGDQDGDSLLRVVPVLTDCLRNALLVNDAETSKNLVCLCTLIFQASSSHSIPTDLRHLLLNTTKSTNGWESYKIGRQAMRYGQYWIAKEVFKSLKKQVSTEHLYFWLNGLEHLCAGEESLSAMENDAGNMIEKITQAVENYHRGVTSLKAAATPSFPLLFQSGYAHTRAQMLQVFTQVLQTCNTFRSCPPPAIATALAITNGQEVSRCGQLISQLHKCACEFGALSQKFAVLYHQSFDADLISLYNVKLLQETCDVLNMAILSVLQNSLTRQSMFLMGLDGAKRRAYSGYTDVLRQIPTAVSAILTDDSNGPLTYIHIETLTEAIYNLISASLGFPRYFFQSLQSTSIKLAISPQPRSLSEPVMLSHDTHLTLKVEGIIQHGKRPGLYRSVHAVRVSVTSNLQARSQMTQESKPQDIVSNDLVKTVEPHNDYFSANFLLTFPVTGIHGVTIRASILDSEDIVWNTSAQSSFLVKSEDQAFQKQQQILIRAMHRASSAAHH